MHRHVNTNVSQSCGFCVAVRQVAILGSYLAVLFALYLVPLGMYSPCIKDEGTLGPAPILIGHRGAPMVTQSTNHVAMFIFNVPVSGKKSLNESVAL